MTGCWTDADEAEMSVLTFELARSYAEHRETCRACKPCPAPDAWRKHKAECPRCAGRAPLSFGPACSRHKEMIEHGKTCVRCRPCPYLSAAVAIVLDWRQARMLRSRAEQLRAELDQLEAA